VFFQLKMHLQAFTFGSQALCEPTGGAHCAIKTPWQDLFGGVREGEGGESRKREGMPTFAKRSSPLVENNL